jgi:hypothetical protein
VRPPSLFSRRLKIPPALVVPPLATVPPALVAPPGKLGVAPAPVPMVFIVTHYGSSIGVREQASPVNDNARPMASQRNSQIMAARLSAKYSEKSRPCPPSASASGSRCPRGGSVVTSAPGVREGCGTNSGAVVRSGGGWGRRTFERGSSASENPPVVGSYAQRPARSGPRNGPLLAGDDKPCP